MGSYSSAILRIRAIAKTHFKNSRASHDWEHTLRVCRLCRTIGSQEEADMDVLLAAAYLHDIGRSDQDVSRGKTCHAQTGAEIASAILNSINLSRSRKRNIIHCIRAHRFRGGHLPKTTEAKILYDADKLDSIGAVGVARAFLFAGEVGARLHNPHIRIEDAPPYSA
ncbi:MAG: HD domain-containing protein, partial [Thermodesulfobacteriota bacterium]